MGHDGDHLRRLESQEQTPQGCSAAGRARCDSQGPEPQVEGAGVNEMEHGKQTQRIWETRGGKPLMITGICISFSFFLVEVQAGREGDVYLYTFGRIILLPAKTRYVSSFDALDTNLVLRSPLPSFCRSFILQASRCNIDFSACSG
jgi:hypothetical protein